MDGTCTAFGRDYLKKRVCAAATAPPIPSPHRNSNGSNVLSGRSRGVHNGGLFFIAGTSPCVWAAVSNLT